MRSVFFFFRCLNKLALKTYFSVGIYHNQSLSCELVVFEKCVMLKGNLFFSFAKINIKLVLHNCVVW